MSTPIIEVRNLSKRFAGVEALRDVSLSVSPGEVLCLLGDNGAGKSTLINILSGVHQPSEGELLVDGAPAHFTSPRAARAAGIATVHQASGTIPLMSVARNFFLGAEPTRGWGPFRQFDARFASRIALEHIRALGITRVTDGSQFVGSLSGGERQALAIARAMYFGARVLILDEPTSALGVKQAAIVLRLIARARDNGIGIVFITHNAHHAMAAGDRFAVLIQGSIVASFAKGERTREELLDLMAGAESMADLENEPS